MINPSVGCLIGLGLVAVALSSATAQKDRARAVWGRFETPAEVANGIGVASVFLSTDTGYFAGNLRQYCEIRGEQIFIRVDRAISNDYSGCVSRR